MDSHFRRDHLTVLKRVAAFAAVAVTAVSLTYALGHLAKRMPLASEKPVVARVAQPDPAPANSAGPGIKARVLVLNDTNEPPFTTAERNGLLDIIGSEAFRRAGLELRLIKLPAARALQLANAGIEDGEFTRIAGLENRYTNLIRVPEKLVDWDFAAFSKDDSIPGNFEVIRGRPVGLIRGWRIYEHAMAGAEHVITVETPEQLFRLLELGRIDVALYVRRSGLAHVQAHNMEGVRVLEPSLARREMFIYLHQRHAEHVPSIASALRALKQDGFYERAYRDQRLLHNEVLQ